MKKLVIEFNKEGNTMFKGFDSMEELSSELNACLEGKDVQRCKTLLMRLFTHEATLEEEDYKEKIGDKTKRLVIEFNKEKNTMFEGFDSMAELSSELNACLEGQDVQRCKTLLMRLFTYEATLEG